MHSLAPRVAGLLLLLSHAALARVAPFDPAALVADPQVAVALDQAGTNRPEILEFVARAARSGDADKAEAGGWVGQAASPLARS